MSDGDRQIFFTNVFRFHKDFPVNDELLQKAPALGSHRRGGTKSIIFGCMVLIEYFSCSDVVIPLYQLEFYGGIIKINF